MGPSILEVLIDEASLNIREVTLLLGLAENRKYEIISVRIALLIFFCVGGFVRLIGCVVCISFVIYNESNDKMRDVCWIENDFFNNE